MLRRRWRVCPCASRSHASTRSCRCPCRSTRTTPGHHVHAREGALLAQAGDGRSYALASPSRSRGLRRADPPPLRASPGWSCHAKRSSGARLPRSAGPPRHVRLRVHRPLSIDHEMPFQLHPFTRGIAPSDVGAPSGTRRQCGAISTSPSARGQRIRSRRPRPRSPFSRGPSDCRVSGFAVCRPHSFSCSSLSDPRTH